MMMRIRLALQLVVLALCAPLTAVQAQPGDALSPRNANYTIEVDLDAEARSLSGSLRLVWTNIEDEATDELRFHLYWNGWRNNLSTWMKEDGYRGRSDRGDDVEPQDWSNCEVTSIRLASGGAGADVDLLPTFRYLWPDDGNIEDRTLFKVDLPRAVEPGETIEVVIGWSARIPRTFARTGYRGDFFFIAHWFPKLGVFENGGWNAHQYHAATEYYSDYGAYDVSMTVPAGWVVGATGREAERRDNGDGTETHRYVQADVHAFTWTTSPDYLVFEDRFDEPGLPAVDLRLLLQPEHQKQAERHFEATRAALKYYGLWFGAYPYDHLTVVDPAFGSGAGGMEYPTLFTAGTRLFNPPGSGRPEGVTIHEAGHQFWYGIVGNNEFEHAWIDEGLNSFADARVMDVAYDDWFYSKRYFTPPGTEAGRGFFPILFRDVRLSREVDGNGLDRYRRLAISDIPLTPTWQYHPRTASGISYSKSAVWLHTLERYLGWETLQAILATFFERHSFAHPKPDDFFAVAAEVTGEDLAWFFDQVMGDSRIFDYAIDSAGSSSEKREGFFGDRGEAEITTSSKDKTDPLGTSYLTEVVVRRLGSGTFPLEILMVFEDGSEVRQSWDGRSQWKKFSHRGQSKLDHAVVDPERVLLLDLNYTNNSRSADEGDRWPAAKWAAKWIAWLQEVLHAFAYFI
jgi:hypothetical protein